MFTQEYNVGDDFVDETYRHVDHMHSLKLMERCRLDLLKAVGVPNDALIARGLYAVVTAVRVEYLREVKAGLIRVTCDRCVSSQRGFTMFQSLFNEKGKIAVRGEIDWLLMDGTTKRGVYPPADLAEALSKFDRQEELK